MAKNTLPRATLLLLFLLILPAIFLFYIGYDFPRQLRLLEEEYRNQEKYREISSDMYHLTTGVQEYILFGDPQALNDFRHYSKETVKKELELYNLAGQSRKQDVAELIALSKAYNSFVEREVAPARQSGAAGNMEILHWQNRDFTRQLVYRADALTRAGQQENRALIEQIVARLNWKGLSMIALSLFFPGVIFAGILLAWNWLVRYHCLDLMVNNSPSAVMIVDRQERLRYLNKFAEGLFQLSREAVSGKCLGEILTMYPNLQNVVQPLYDSLLQNKKFSDYRLNFTREEGELLLSLDCTPVCLFRRPSCSVLVARETAKPREGSILLDTIERERKRLSIEIHDWIGRYMSSIIHNVDYILRMNGSKLPQEVNENLIMLRSQCQNAAIDMRSIMNDIHPYLIEKMGLIPALESYSDSFERIHNKKIYIFYHQDLLRLDREKEILIYRIIQEALTNVARHSPATEVDIHFIDMKDTLKIEIIDNGEIGETADPAPGNGLWGMKERARLAGGDLDYGFTDRGFCVTLTLPLAEGVEADGKNRNHAG